MKNFILFLLAALPALAGRSQGMVTDRSSDHEFPIFGAQYANKYGVAPIYVDPKDHWLVGKAASLLQQDIRKVTGLTPSIISDLSAAGPIPFLIIIGSLDRSALMQRLARQNMIPSSTKGQWESFVLKTVHQPLIGIGQALIIAGSDRRGTAYGVFELSRQMGVSPWYWWADVPIKHRDRLYFRSKTIYQSGPPAIKYRGIFINDEAPALSGWTREKFGGFNHLFYEKVFELLLRLKANYLWPAMWGSAFNDDDPENPIMASNYGIVMGTSHHEPMLRAQQEWKRYGAGPWNYQTNAPKLDSFWQKGIEKMDHHESILAIGMRGDGDMPMEESSNIALLEKIVTDQRAIIGKVTGKDPSATPQSWALYKEVQDYYDKGMRVPDDVTLLLCDDNWGNVRKLPRPGDPIRGGGYGMYYHFDYVGGPRNYKWINTNQISRIWEEMHLAKAYGDDRIWIVNAGDIKPMEFPISFFLDYAWNPDRWPAEKLPEYTAGWAAEQFGPKYAATIAGILTKYTQYNARRKPELLSPDTYSMEHYNEARTVVADYNDLSLLADSIYQQLPKAYRDAYYQLVLYPVQASANLNNLYYRTAFNRLSIHQGRSLSNYTAEDVENIFGRDSLLSHYYNKEMAGGKWDHMMDQTHIGYTGWQEPPRNVMPHVDTLSITRFSHLVPSWGVTVEGSRYSWPKDADSAVAELPAFNRYQDASQNLIFFDRSIFSYAVSIKPGAAWIQCQDTDVISQTHAIPVNIDWAKAPPGHHQAPIVITGQDGAKVTVTVTIDNPSAPTQGTFNGFVGTDGYVSIEAEHYTNKIEGDKIQWLTIPGLGRTLSAVQAEPVTAPPQTPGGNSPRLEYRLWLFDTGTVSVQLYFSPIIAFNGQPIRYAISFDDAPPQFVDLSTGNEARGSWDQMVADNIKISVSRFNITRPGQHLLKYWLVDPGPVLQKIVVDAGGVKPSYLGPPESPFLK